MINLILELVFRPVTMNGLMAISVPSVHLAPQHSAGIYSSQNYTYVRVQMGGGPYTSAVAVSADSRRVARALDDNTFEIWDLRQKSKSSSFELPSGGDYPPAAIRSLCFTPGGLLMLDRSGVALYFSIAERKFSVLRHFPCAANPPMLQFIANGTEFAFSDDRNRIMIQSLRGDGPAREVTRPDPGIEHASICPSGDTLAIGYKDGTVKLMDVNKNQVLCRLKGTLLEPTSPCFSSDGHGFICSGGDSELLAWSSHSPKFVKKISVPVLNVTATISKDGKYLAVSDQWDYVEVFTLDGQAMKRMPSVIAGSPKHKAILLRGYTDMMSFTTNIDDLVYSSDGKVWMWTFRSGKPIALHQ